MKRHASSTSSTKRDGLDVHRVQDAALSNLDFHVTFTPELLRKDIDLGWRRASTSACHADHLDHPRHGADADRHGYDQDFSQLLLLQAKPPGSSSSPKRGRRRRLS